MLFNEMHPLLLSQNKIYPIILIKKNYSKFHALLGRNGI